MYCVLFLFGEGMSLNVSLGKECLFMIYYLYSPYYVNIFSKKRLWYNYLQSPFLVTYQLDNPLLNYPFPMYVTKIHKRLSNQ